MLLLNSTGDLLKFTTSTAQAVDIKVDWIDNNGTTTTPGVAAANISSATTTSIPGTSPASGYARNIEYVSVCNKGSSSNVVTIQALLSGTTVTLYVFTLNAGYTWTLNAAGQTNIIDPNGNNLTSSAVGAHGAFVTATVLTSSSGTFTTSATTNKIRLRGVAAGGAGAGTTSVASAAGGGGGGGAGSDLEVWIPVTPSTGYSYTCGTGGTGVSAGTGNTGGTSTFIVGATTYTCYGGVGGTAATSASTGSYLGGAGGAVSTNGLINNPGQPGAGGFTISATVYQSGDGAKSPFGAGGIGAKSAGTGAAGTGFGSGGAGGAAGASTATTGGAGAPGMWISEEYT